MVWYLRSSLRLLPSCRIPARQFSFTRLHRFPPTTVNGTHKLPWFTSVPSFRQQVARTGEVPSFTERVRSPSVKNQVWFFAFGSFFVFCVAARITNTETYEWSNQLSSSSPAWKFRPPTDDEMRRARYYTLGKTLQDNLSVMKDVIEEWPISIKNMLIWTYIQVAQPVLDTTEGRRICWTIGLLNGIMYLAWQFPRTKPLMQARFAHNPLSGLSYTMLTSLFSHRRFIHVWVNSLGLAAFGSAAAQHFFEKHGHDPDNLREATPKWHFLAFFISAGLFSNLVSHVAATRITFPRLVSRLRSAAATAPPAVAPAASTPKASYFARFRRMSTAPAKEKSETAAIPFTLGASGVVYSVYTVVALAYPDTELAMKIPPTFPIPIGWGLSALLAFDTLGIIRGWTLFNHWAHLSGAAFGLFYFKYGSAIWEAFRELTLGSLPPTLCDLPLESEDE